MGDKKEGEDEEQEKEILRALVVERAISWATIDPNPTTAEYVRQLVTTATNRSTTTTTTEEEKEQDKSTAAAVVAIQELKELFPITTNSTSMSCSNTSNYVEDRISFGTAGLRAKMQPGPMGMNDLVVIQTAQGLAQYYSSSSSSNYPTKKKPKVMIGYDHRTNRDLHISSLSFALWTTIVFQQAGWDTCLFDGYVPTPLIPFAMMSSHNNSSNTKKKNSTSTSVNVNTDNDDDVDNNSNIIIGIMITASHNPKQDAGYKIYGIDGCQIRSPVDKEITASIQKELQPWVDYHQVYMNLVNNNSAIHHHHEHDDPCLGLSKPKETQELKDAYCMTLKLSGLVVPIIDLTTTQSSSIMNTPSGPKFCYTAMHGVGYPMANEVFTQVFQLGPLYSVPQQQEPDYNFSTVPFPNPEENGALDIAMQYAHENQCNIILANDPDADRLAVAEYQIDQQEWIIFTGDQIGCLLGHWLWQNLATKNKDLDQSQQHQQHTSPMVAMCASAVSSKLLAEIARKEGFHYEETLTGFKWIGSRAAELQRSGQYTLLFCYEEALGFCCGNIIFDKDGLSAMGVMGQLITHVYQKRQMTLQQHLQSLYDQYGEFVSNNGYFHLSDVTMVPVIMNYMIKHGAYDQIQFVGPFEVSRVRFLGEPGYDSATKDYYPTLPTSKSSPMITFWFKNGCVAQFRASGTEPKFKYYIELQGKPGIPRNQVQQDLLAMTPILLEELLRPSQHGLTHK